MVLYLILFPFWLSIVYMLFGDNFFLFRWVDNVLIFLIKHLVSNLSMTNFLMNPLLFILLLFSMGSDLTEFHVLAMIFGSLTSGYFWDFTMKKSVGAIRYLDPSWNEVQDGERLWPSIAHGLGLTKKNSRNSSVSSNDPEGNNKGDSIDEVKDQSWTLNTNF